MNSVRSVQMVRVETGAEDARRDGNVAATVIPKVEMEARRRTSLMAVARSGRVPAGEITTTTAAVIVRRLPSSRLWMPMRIAKFPLPKSTRLRRVCLPWIRTKTGS
jgi:hypothetical protein